MSKLHNSSNGPFRDVSPAPTPSHTKPDPHLDSDPPALPEYEPYHKSPATPRRNNDDRTKYWDLPGLDNK